MVRLRSDVDAVNAAELTDPRLIPGLALWLDASDPRTINAGAPADGDPVSAWRDKSGAGHDAAQATAINQPAFKTAILNGRSIVRFDASVTPRYLAIATALALFKQIDGFTIAWVAQQATGLSGDIFSADDVAHTLDRVESLLSGGTTILEHVINYTNDASTSALVLTPTAQVLDTNPIGAVTAVDLAGGRYNAQMTQVWTPAQSYAGPFVPGPSDNTASTAVLVGSTAFDPTSSPFTGDLGELLVWPRELNAPDCRRVAEYLAAKWGV